MRTLVSAIGALVLLSAPETARAAIHWRPTNPPPGPIVTLIAPTAAQPYNDYATPETIFSGRSAVVHYVTHGIDAPPLNDDDGNSVPDYVERVAEAADRSIAYFERRGFASILDDTAGPDARPDIYISRFAPGTFGIAYPSVDAWGGAFVVVSNSLDPSGGASLGSIYGIVAHELFHLVQFSYFGPEDDPVIPVWTREGSAAAIENRVFPDLDDIVNDLQLRPWLAAPDRSVTTQTYGAQLLWRYLDERQPKLLPTYLSVLASTNVADQGRSVFVTTFRRVAHTSFQRTFLDFATIAARDHGARIHAVATLQREGYGSSVPPLAIHYVRISGRLARAAPHVSVRVARGDARAAVAFVYEWESDIAGEPSEFRLVKPTRSSRGDTLCFTLPSARRSARFQAARVIVANGRAKRALRYVIATTGPC